jgi:ABC-type antimicrobial peptide transport system permease subunit
MSSLFQDFRFAPRQLGKNRVFTIIVVATLALGIGANTAIFTLINDLLLKSLPVRDPQGLVAFGQQAGGGAIDGIGPGPLDLFPLTVFIAVLVVAITTMVAGYIPALCATRIDPLVALGCE